MMHVSLKRFLGLYCFQIYTCVLCHVLGRICNLYSFQRSSSHWPVSFFFPYSEEWEKMKIPKDMNDAKALGTVLSKYKDTYYTQVLVAYFTTYVLYPL